MEPHEAKNICGSCWCGYHDDCYSRIPCDCDTIGHTVGIWYREAARIFGGRYAIDPAELGNHTEGNDNG